MAQVLLVDDNGSVLLTLAIALRRRGHVVTMAADGAHALRELGLQHFDFLVSDVRMPGMTGVELATAARALPQPPRVILTSAYSSVEGREEIAEAFLRKPIDTEQLDALLQDVTPRQQSSAESKHAVPQNAQPKQQKSARGFQPAFN